MGDSLPDIHLLKLNKLNLDVLVEVTQKTSLSARLQKILTSQRVRLKNLSGLLICNFAAAGLSFVTTVKIANMIGKENFGNLAYAMALGMYGQAFVRYGMDRTLVRDLIHYPKRFAELVAGSLLLRGSLQFLIITGLLVSKLVFNVSGAFSWGLIFIVITYGLRSLDLQTVYDAWMKMGRHAAYNLIRRIAYFLFIWTIILWSPEHLSIILIGSGLLATEILYLFLQQRWAFRRIDFGAIKAPLTSVAIELSKSNFWIWLASMGFLSFGSLNQIILKHYCGAAELGGYAASWQIASAVMLLLTQVGRIGNPATASATRPETNRKPMIHFLSRYSVVMLLIAAPICIPLFFFPELILKTIFKPEYASAAGVLQILSIYLLVVSLGIVASQYVISSRMERTYFVSVIMGGILSITLCLSLIPTMAGYGSALALLIAHGASMSLYWVVMIQHVRKQR